VGANPTAVGFTHTAKRWNMQRPCSESGTCAPERCPPPAAPFPPQPPRKVSLRCSAGSQVLWHSPTSPTRACPHYGLWPSRTGPPRQAKACWRSPGSRACCFLACAGSIDYAGPDHHSRITRLPYCLPPTHHGVGTLIYRLFEAQSPRPPIPPFYASSATPR
jgi:hypothetical protein